MTITTTLAIIFAGLLLSLLLYLLIRWIHFVFMLRRGYAS